MNLQKHGISFEEASTVFGDPLSLTIPDPRRVEEDRFITIGVSTHLNPLVVIHTDRADHTRLISARKTTGMERDTYENKAK